MVLEESKMYAGRITRYELNYHNRVPYLDEIFTKEDETEFFRRLEQMTFDEKMTVVRNINNYFRNLMNRIETNYIKHSRSLNPYNGANCISGGHGGYAHSIFGRSGKSFAGSVDPQGDIYKKLDERDTYMQNFKTKYNILSRQYQDTLNSSNGAANQPQQRTNYINNIKQLKEDVFDFILEFLPGRTFLKG